MQLLLPLIITSIGSVIASSGFWAFIQRKSQTKSTTNKLLLGLAYDKIVTLGMTYVDRGHITRDEYEEFVTYLYQPYKECGGNGTAERVMAEVAKLPLVSPDRYMEINS